MGNYEVEFLMIKSIQTAYILRFKYHNLLQNPKTSFDTIKVLYLFMRYNLFMLKKMLIFLGA